MKLRYRLHRRWFRAPLVVLQVGEAERDSMREKLEVERENLKAIVDLWYEPSSLTNLGAAVKMGETARDALAKIDAPADTQRGE